MARAGKLKSILSAAVLLGAATGISGCELTRDAYYDYTYAIFGPAFAQQQAKLMQQELRSANASLAGCATPEAAAATARVNSVLASYPGANAPPEGARNFVRAGSSALEQAEAAALDCGMPPPIVNHTIRKNPDPNKTIWDFSS